MNFFQQGIPLGRWFGITVVIHWTFLLYAAFQLFSGSRTDMAIDALFIGLLFGTVLVHEFGHALSCLAVGGQAHHIVLWPLGGIAFVQPPPNPWAWLITTVCGPLVNAILWPTFYFATRAVVLHQYGADLWSDLDSEVGRSHGIMFVNLSWPVQLCLTMWQINRLLLLFNLIPAYPMDGGRLLQELLWIMIGYGRSLMIAGMVGVATGAAFMAIGLGFYSIQIPIINFSLGSRGNPQPMLAIIGLMCAMQSWGIYQRSHEIKSWRKN